MARLGDSEIASFFKPHMGSALYQLQFHGKTFSATDLAALVLNGSSSTPRPRWEKPSIGP